MYIKNQTKIVVILGQSSTKLVSQFDTICRIAYKTVIGAIQRPASIDKHFFGNARIVRTGRLNYADDVKNMANVMNVLERDIQDLQPLEFIQRDMTKGLLNIEKSWFKMQASITKGGCMKKSMVDISPLSNESWDVYVDRTSDLAEKESEEMGWLSTVEVEV